LEILFAQHLELTNREAFLLVQESLEALLPHFSWRGAALPLRRSFPIRRRLPAG
jgi:hypothetical protein